MSEKPISPLLQRLLEDMSLRGFTPDTQRDYAQSGASRRTSAISKRTSKALPPNMAAYAWRIASAPTAEGLSFAISTPPFANSFTASEATGTFCDRCGIQGISRHKWLK